MTDRKGQITAYTYDPLNRRTKTLFHDNTSTNYTYDAGNRLKKIEEKNASNVVTATITRDYYDVDDQLKQEITPQGQVDYTYDAAGRRATMTGGKLRKGDRLLFRRGFPCVAGNLWVKNKRSRSCFVQREVRSARVLWGTNLNTVQAKA